MALFFSATVKFMSIVPVIFLGLLALFQNVKIAPWKILALDEYVTTDILWKD